LDLLKTISFDHVYSVSEIHTWQEGGRYQP
jgi:hypothetical protein